MNREAYAKIIAEDIAWCEAQPRTLEREHVIAVLRYAVAAEYPRPLSADISRAWAERLSVAHDERGNFFEEDIANVADALRAASRGEYPEVKP